MGRITIRKSKVMKGWWEVAVNGRTFARYSKKMMARKKAMMLRKSKMKRKKK